MGIGINDTINLTIANIKQLSNLTRPEEFFVRVNYYVYDGALYFIMLWVFAIILFLVLQKSPNSKDQLLNNMMISFAITSIISMFLRVIQFTLQGEIATMLTDQQMWVFPILTLVLAGVVWSVKKISG